MTPQSLPPEEAAPDEGNPIPAAPPGRPRLPWARGSDSVKVKTSGGQSWKKSSGETTSAGFSTMAGW